MTDRFASVFPAFRNLPGASPRSRVQVDFVAGAPPRPAVWQQRLASRGVLPAETRELARLAGAECLVVDGADHLQAIRRARDEVSRMALETFERAESEGLALPELTTHFPGDTDMDIVEVRNKVKEIIANVTNVEPQDIADDASFVDDLQLDSLSLLEIGVDVDYEYKLGLPEEELSQLRTVADAVDLVMRTLGVEKADAAVAA